MHIIAEKGIRLDLGYAEEHSKKWALAMLLRCNYDRLPPAKTIYRLLQEFKTNWDSEKKSWTCKWGLSDYPQHPSGLPQHTYDAEFGDDPPVELQINGIHSVADAIPMRGNSKLLKQP